MKSFTTRLSGLSIAASVTMLLTGCFSDKRSPGWDYMPDMRYSQAYDAYSENPNFAHGTNLMPVPGTVPLYQGVMGQRSNYTPYPYPNTNEGYAAAGAELKNPIAATPDVLEEGARLYVIYCSPCHGPQGEGNGSIVVNDKIINPFPPPPSYFSERWMTLPDGQMFHTIQHGRNLMGSYASQVDQREAWMIIHHINALQAQHGAGNVPAGISTDSTAAANAATPVHNAAGVQTQSTPAQKQ